MLPKHQGSLSEGHLIWPAYVWISSTFWKQFSFSFNHILGNSKLKAYIKIPQLLIAGQEPRDKLCNAYSNFSLTGSIMYSSHVRELLQLPAIVIIVIFKNGFQVFFFFLSCWSTSTLIFELILTNLERQKPSQRSIIDLKNVHQNPAEPCQESL